MGKIATKDTEKSSAYRVQPFTPDAIPQTVMSKTLAQKWESAKRNIKAREGNQTYRTWFEPLRFYGKRGDVLIFSAPTPFFAGQSINGEWGGELLRRNLQREMGTHEVIVDNRLKETEDERLRWGKRYFAKWLAEQPPMPSFVDVEPVYGEVA